MEDCSYYNTPDFSLSGFQGMARVVNVHDGDTYTLILNIFNSFYKFKVRLNGIDTCELSSKNETLHNLGNNAKNKVLKLLGIDVPIDFKLSRNDVIKKLDEKCILVRVKCGEFDKYGRLLCDVFINNISLAEILINEKLAIRYDGGTKLNDDKMASMLATI